MRRTSPFANVGAAVLMLMWAMCSLGGCLAEPDEPVDTPEPAEDEEVFTSTTIDLDQGGIIVGQFTFTRAQQEQRRLNAELARDGLGRSSDAVMTEDADCWTPLFNGTNLLRLYDQINYTGNVLCFIGSGYVDLGSYCRGTPVCLTDWEGAVRSYKTGTASASFSPDGACCSICHSAADQTNVPDAGACEEAAIYAHRGGGCVAC